MVVASLATAILFVTQVYGQADVQPKRVMILHSLGREFRPYSVYANDIRAELDRQSRWPVDVQEHSLVSARSGDPRAEALFLDYIRALYAGGSPDLVISVGAPSAGFLQRHRQELFPATPILFTVVEQRRVQYLSLTDNDTVVAVRHDFRALFESFLQIVPDTKVIAIINGNSPIEKYWKKEMQRELQPLDGRIEIRWYDEVSYEDVLKQTASLPLHSAIFWYAMGVDGAGVAHEGDRALTRLSATANAPIFTHDDAFFGQGIIGGPMHSALGGSQRAMAVAMRILGGEKPGDIKTPPSDFAPPKYDWRQLRRWNISESLLPPGSQILFREPSAWQLYSWQIALIIAVLLAQAGLISALLHERRRRQLAEVQSLQRMAELARVIRFSTAGELTGSIAHEINQPLGAILANAETAQAILKSPSPDVAELNEIVGDILRDDQRASEVIRRMRSLLTKAPFELKSLDLNDVVRETAEFFSTLAVARKVELTSSITPDSASDPRRPHPASTSDSEPCRERDRRDEGYACRKLHHPHSDFARRKVCRAISVGSRPGHTRRQAKRGLRTILQQQGRRHGHGVVDRANHYRGAQWADMGKKSRSRRRVVPDQASSGPIVDDPWPDPYEACPTSGDGALADQD